MQQKGNFRQRLRYRVDNALSRSVTYVLVWVGLALFALVLLVSLGMWLWEIGPEDQAVSYWENLWLSLTRSLDPGTFSGDIGTRFRFAGLIVTLGGLLAVSLVIGLISNAVDTRLDLLRRGRSLVVESGHTLLLGYSSKLALVVRELLEACESEPNRSIVILTSEDKIELEESLRRQLPRKFRTRLVVRRGEPASLHDLGQVRPESASAVVVLRPDDATADAAVVRVAMAVHQARHGLAYIPIVVELESLEVARSLRHALPDSVLTVVSSEFVARIAAQTARASGLGTVYQELLDFAGDEFYTVPVPKQLVGIRFGDALLASDTCTTVGLIQPSTGVRLCPPLDTVLDAADQLVMIAQDDSALRFHASPPLGLLSSADERPGEEREVAKTLVIGWNRYARRILEEIDANSLPGSSLLLVIDPEVPESFEEDELNTLTRHTAEFRYGSTVDRAVLHDALAQGPFAHILVLCSHDQLTPLESDARALLALMHVRNHLDRLPENMRAATNLVSEVLEPQSVEIAQVARPDDFIVSQRLVALYLAQLAEKPQRKKIIEQVLSADGPEVGIVPCTRYLPVGTHTFADLVAAAAQRGGVAIGWRHAGEATNAHELGGGIRINPAKSERLQVSNETKAIVLLPA